MININMRNLLRQDMIKVFLLLFFTALVLYLPILIHTSILLNRGNDLEEQFWPVFYLVNKSLWENLTLPLWSNLRFSGMPLLPDPQFSLFYPGNFFFYIFPTNTAFLIYFITHTFLGGIGAYLLARCGLKLSEISSIFAGVLYIILPRISGYLEAGHFGLVGSSAWLPFVFLGIILLTRELRYKWAVLVATGLAGLFFTHTVNFLIILAVSIVTFFTLFFLYPIKKRAFTLFFLAGVLTIGLSAITLLPQLEWLPTTTRSLLLSDRVVYPIWTGIFEFLRNIFLPWLGGTKALWNIDTEKWLALGITPAILAFIGFLNLEGKLKAIIAIVSIITVLIALNNASPLYSFLISIDWYVLSRVSTRVWIIPTVMIVFLASYGFDKLFANSSRKKFACIFLFLSIIESIALSWLRLAKPIPVQTNFVPEKVYQFLSSSKDHFRVFCVTHCLTQKSSALYNLELVEGYNTLQQKNYFDQFIQLSQVYWNRYTLSLPPFEIYKFVNIQPYTPELADYNVKYVISPYKLKDKNLILKKQIEDYLIYENTIVKSRAFFANGSKAPILNYSPNFIKVDTSNHPSLEFTLSEVWSSGWKAYLNGIDETTILEPKNKLRNLKIKEDTKFVDFVYLPDSFMVGGSITLITSFIITIFGLKKWLKKNY